MQAAVLDGARHIIIEDRPIPQPGPGDVLVQVHRVAVCGSDLARFWSEDLPTGARVVMGHEFSGRVATLGPGVDEPAAGQWVTVAPLLNCGQCALCLAGRSNLCAQRLVFGRDVDGALQEYVAVRADRVFPLPPAVPAVEGTMVEPLAVACHAVRRAGLRSSGSTLVLGAGAIGLLIGQVWRSLGGGPVAVVDLDDSRLAIASSLGLTVWTGASPGSRVDTLFEATGSPEAFAAWLPALAPTGRAVVVGKLDQPVAIDCVSLMRREAEITTSRYFTLDDFRQALHLLKKGRVRVSPLIGRTVPFQRLREQTGQTVMAEARQAIRLLIELHDE
jgi:2-desacetyl-2-hydroxyethyl bacteriochlorophyllide A dehydrogenase